MKRSNLFGGIILIFLGVVFILANLGFLQWNFFLTYFSFWPIFLIALGLLIMIRNNIWIQLVALLLVLIVPLGYYLGVGPLYTFNGLDRLGIVTGKVEEYSWSLEKNPTVTRAELSLEYDVGHLTVGFLNNPAHLVNFEAKSFLGRPAFNVNQSRSKAELSIKQGWSNFPYKPGALDNEHREECVVNLNKDVIWDLEFDTGATKALFNLQELKFDRMDVDSGVGDVRFVIGDMGINAKVVVDAGVGNVTFVIPEKVGVRANIDTGIGKTNLAGRDWQQTGDVYISSNYEQANTKIQLEIDQGVGNISIVTE